MLRELSAATGVSIIASTGFHKRFFYRNDSPVFSLSEEELTGCFCRDIRNRRCGLIKAAAEAEPMSGHSRLLHTAAARASLLTNAPVLCHIDRGVNPLSLLAFYTDLGVAAESMILCHCDRAVDDLSLHIAAASQGAFLEYDTIARPKYHSDDTECRIIARLIAKGLGHRLLLGLDTTRERLRAYNNPDAPGLSYLRECFLPRLRRAGIAEERLRLITEVNPVSAFSFALKPQQYKERPPSGDPT